MRWSDTAYLISIISTKENTSLIKVFQSITVVILVYYLAVLQKKKPDLQLGNKIKVHYNSKSEDRMGYFSLN